MADNTFLGLQPYTEDDAYRFKGRTEESQELFRLIVRNDFTVCYAESGEGKTSLLNAGVFPLLRENMYFPIAITFTSDDYKVTPDSFDAIIDRCIKDSIAEYNEKNKGVDVEYKLSSTDFQGLERQEELQRELSKYSWWKLRNYKPQAMGLTFTPVFVFDQFEEVFNLPGSIVWTKKFFDWLENVSSDSSSDDVVKKVRKIIGDKAAFPTIKEEKDFKAVYSLRKEFIGELDYWGMQTHFVPALKDNRYCLKALTYDGAKKVMTQQERFDEDKVEQVLTHFVGQYSREPKRTIAENLPAIPALLLSVVCDSWEKDIAAFAKFSTDEIGRSLNKTLEKFYDETIEAVIKELVSQNKEAVMPDLICKDIDTAMFDLVDVNGKRVRVKAVTTLGTISLDSGKRFSETLPIVKYKDILNKHRIIKITKIDGEDYVEIVHDCLCPIIAKRREVRLAVETKEREERLLREQAKKMRKRISVFGLLAIIALGLMTLFIWMQRENVTEREAKEEFKNQRDAVQKQKDEMSLLNDSISKLNRDLLGKMVIIENQRDSIKKSLSFSNMLIISLNEQIAISKAKNDSLIDQIEIVAKQNRTIEYKNKKIEEQIRELKELYALTEEQATLIKELEVKVQINEIDLWLKLGGRDSLYSEQLEELAKSGHDAAQNRLGFCYLEGAGIGKDFEKGFYWLNKALEQGNLKAMNSVAFCYENGFGVEKDERKAFTLYRKAAFRGMPAAFTNLAQCYLNGVGTPIDSIRARIWFEKGAEYGTRVAQNNVGFLYAKEKNYEKAFYWLSKAAEQGSPNAYEMLGYFYEEGLGIDKNAPKAIECYRKAYELGNLNALQKIKHK